MGDKQAQPGGKGPANFQWDGKVNSAAEAYQGHPMRVLVLHGMGGSADSFPGAIEQLTKHCGGLIEPVFAQAVHPCGPSGWAWFPLDKAADWKVAWDATISSLREFMAAHGPFDGLMGVSMGSCCAACLLTACPRDTFRFVILTCAYSPSDEQSFLIKALAARKPIEMPSLHIFSPRTRATPNRTRALCRPPHRAYARARVYARGFSVPRGLSSASHGVQAPDGLL